MKNTSSEFIPDGRELALTSPTVTQPTVVRMVRAHVSPRRDAGSILPGCRSEKILIISIGLSASGRYVYPGPLVSPVVSCPEDVDLRGGGDSAGLVLRTMISLEKDTSSKHLDDRCQEFVAEAPSVAVLDIALQAEGNLRGYPLQTCPNLKARYSLANSTARHAIATIYSEGGGMIHTIDMSSYHVRSTPLNHHRKVDKIRFFYGLQRPRLKNKDR
ncbi:hypothetical protein LXL04_011245 [Taraxacum kok-saghyz]